MTIELALLAIVDRARDRHPGRHRLGGRQAAPAWDYAANAVALWGLSTPNFWLGIMLILLFSVQLGWLPASGYVSPFEDLRANLAAMIMPAFVLGNAIAAVLMRHTRSAMLQVLSSDYVRTARAKGLDERVVVLKHALRNALTPIITLGALEFGTLLSGAVLTEQVFTIPGFGKLIVDAVFNRDYAVVQGVVLVTATAYIAAQPARRHRLLPRQSAAARLSGADATTPSDRRAAAATASRRRARRAGGGCCAGAARWSAWSSSSCFVVIALVRAVDRAVRPDRDQLERDPQGAVARRTGSAPTRSAATCCRASIWGARASLLAGVVSVLDLAAARRADRARSPATSAAGRRADLAHHRRDARLPVPDPGDRARRVPRPEPHQRDDRDRHLGHADLRPPDARAGARRQGRGLRRGGARASATRRCASRCATCCPTSLPPLIVQATLAIAAAVIAEASLSFLGLGQQPPAPSWGSMLNTAKNYIDNAPWMAVWPGLSIFLLVLSFNLLGDGLRDALDPRQR